MDVHAPLGIYDKHPASNFVPVTGIYNIPFRCLYSRDIRNLMVAGRNISVTHIALGSTRVMATCGALGQAAGTAAYLCSKYDTTPNKINNNHIDELQRILLLDDQTILHRYDSIFKNFTANASSEKKYENTEKCGFMQLVRPYSLSLMCDTDHVESLEIYAKGKGYLNFKVLNGKHKETFIPCEIVNEEFVKIDGENWVNIPVSSPVGKDSKIYVVFCENPEIEIGIANERVMESNTERMHTNFNCEGKNHDSVPLDDRTGYICLDHIYEKNRNILFKNIIPEQNVFSAKNAVNGYARQYGYQNIWLPESLPATITLTSNAPMHCSVLDVIFDNSLDVDEKVTSLHKTLAKSFNVNTSVEKIEITINESYGKSAGIYGIRIK